MTDFSADHGPNARACVVFSRSAAFAQLSPRLQAAIDALIPGMGKSNVDCFVGLAELAFANRQALPPEALRLGAQCAFICRINHWHGLGDGRGWALQQALQRDAGDPPNAGAPWPDPVADPEPDSNRAIGG